MRIAFFGTGAFGGPTLRALAARHEVNLVVSQPDRPRGRGRQLQPTEIKEVALELGLAVFQPEKINTPDSIARLAEHPAELGVVIAYGQKIGAAVRELYRHRCVNLHASILPRWRGAAPINWAILAGDELTGVSIFELVDKMDAGPLWTTAQTRILPGETADALHDRLAIFGVEPMLETIAGLAAGTLVAQAQDESQVTLARKLSRADAAIDFSRSAGEIANQVHGLWSWPGAQAELQYVDLRHQPRQEMVTLAAVEACSAEADDSASAPGTLIAPDRVACGQGQLRLLQLKPAGKGVMTWPDFARGRPLRFGPDGSRFVTVNVDNVVPH